MIRSLVAHVAFPTVVVVGSVLLLLWLCRIIKQNVTLQAFRQPATPEGNRRQTTVASILKLAFIVHGVYAAPASSSGLNQNISLLESSNTTSALGLSTIEGLIQEATETTSPPAVIKEAKRDNHRRNHNRKKNSKYDSNLQMDHRFAVKSLGFLGAIISLVSLTTALCYGYMQYVFRRRLHAEFPTVPLAYRTRSPCPFSPEFAPVPVRYGSPNSDFPPIPACYQYSTQISSAHLDSFPSVSEPK